MNTFSNWTRHRGAKSFLKTIANKSMAFAIGLCATATMSTAAVVIYSEEVGSDVHFSYSGSLDLTGLVAGGVSTNNSTFAGLGAHENYFGNISNTSHQFYQSPFTATTGSVYSGVNSGYHTDSIAHSGDPFFFRNFNVAVVDGYTGDLFSGSFTLINTDFTSLSLVENATMTKTLVSNDTITWNVFADPNSVSAVPLPAALPMLLAALGGLGIAGRRRRKTA